MIDLHEGDLYDAIGELNKTQFPKGTVTDFCNKAIEELGEVKDAPKSKRLGEFADACICVWGACTKDGWTYEELMVAIATKTSVNRRRKFERLENGVYQHLEQE